MPQSYQKIVPHPAKPIRTLADAARDGQIIRVRCGLCRKRANFLARDLVQILDPKRPVWEPPYPCSTCKSTEFLDVKVNMPQPGDYGSLNIRRPAGIRKIQMWRTCKLGDE